MTLGMKNNRQNSQCRAEVSTAGFPRPLMKIVWLILVTSAENSAWSVLIMQTLGAYNPCVELACSFLGASPCLVLSIHLLEHASLFVFWFISLRLFLSHNWEGQGAKEKEKQRTNDMLIKFIRSTATGSPLELGFYGVLRLSCSHSHCLN